MGLTCSQCGAETALGARFCLRCGMPLAVPRFCVQCGAEVATGNAFCPFCGAGQSVFPAAQRAPVPADAEAGPSGVQPTRLPRRGGSRLLYAGAVLAILTWVLAIAGMVRLGSLLASPVPTGPDVLLSIAVQDLAQTAAQQLVQPPSVEDALRDIYLRLGLEDLAVSYRDGTLHLAFEQPDLPAGHLQAVYLLVLDVAALNAPFSQQVAVTVKIDGRPWTAIAAKTVDLQAFRRGELAQGELSRRLAYSLPLVLAR